MGYICTIMIRFPPAVKGTEYKVEGEEMAFIRKFSESFPKVRGRVIDITLVVERGLEQVILRAKKHMGITLIFDQYGTFNKDYTFYNKWQDFRTITKHENFPLKTDYKGLRRDVLSAISIRNKYTHGELFYDFEKKVFFIAYEEDGKKEAEVSDKIVEEEMALIDSTRTPLQKITNFFDTEKGK